MIRSRSSILFFVLLPALAALLMGAAMAQAQTLQQTLNQYISDLQKNPNDYALREKIIKHVQTMKPVPAVPDEARRFMNRGMAAAEGAKTESDYRDAIHEFQKAGQYAQALQNLKLYLLANPPATDAEAAKTLMDKIEYRQEKAAKESSPAAIAAKKQNEYAEWLKKLNGAQWRNDQIDTTSCTDNYIEMRNREIRTGWITVRPGAPSCQLNPRMGDGRTIYRGTVEGRSFVFTGDSGTSTGTISEDGEVIKVDFRPSPSAPPIFKPYSSSYTRVKNPRWTIWNR
jgi:hypothetical protein